MFGVHSHAGLAAKANIARVKYGPVPTHGLTTQQHAPEAANSASVNLPGQACDTPPPSSTKPQLPEPRLKIPQEDLRMLPTYKSCDFAGMPRPAWLVRGVIHGGEVIILWGESQAGKTALLLDMVAAIATGSDWAGHPVIQTNVLYVALEGQIGLRTRAQALEHVRGLGHLDGIIYCDAPCNVASDKDVNALALTALRHHAKFIVIDTLSASIAGVVDENSNSAMAGVIANAQRLMQMTGAAVLLVHHTGNDPKRGTRGAYALRANPDVCIEVACSGDERYWRVDKSRDGNPGTAGMFRIEPVTFQPPHEPEPLESIVVRHVEQAEGDSPVPPTAGGRSTKATGRAKRALVAIQARLVNSIYVDGPPAQALEMPHDEAEEVVKAEFRDLSSKHRAQYAREAIKALVDEGKLIRDGDKVRLPQRTQ